MNKKVKVLSAALCTAIAITSLAPAASASAVTSSPSIELPQGDFSVNKRVLTLGKDELSKKVFDSVEAISPYINKGSDNLYHLDPAAKEVVGDEVYNQFVIGVNNLNAAINGEVTSNSGQIVTPNAFSNSYWWGVAITFDNAETKRFAESLQTTSSVGSFLAAIAIFIPVARVGALVAELESIGANYLANQFFSKNAGKGVTLNIHWAPVPLYTTVTTNGG